MAGHLSPVQECIDKETEEPRFHHNTDCQSQQPEVVKLDIFLLVFHWNMLM